MDRWKAIALVLGGLLVGSWMAGPSTTSATGHQKFQKCAELCNMRRGAAIKASKLEKVSREIPDGWTVISASGGDESSCILLCR